MKLTVGNVVRHGDFFDREDLLREIWDALETDSILLAAPRRVGKTSLMHRLMDVPERGFKTMFLDGQNHEGPEDIVTELVAEAGRLRGNARHLFDGVLERVEEVGIWQLRAKFRETVGDTWREQGERAVRDALEGDARLVIILDELPLLLHKMVRQDGERGKEKAHMLLDWLRHLRTHRDFNERVRQVLGGSIGMPRIASWLGASHKINDLRPMRVDPLTAAKAEELAHLLFESRLVEVDEGSMRALLAQVETFYPILIQIMVASVCSDVRDRGIEVTPEVISACYDQRALGPEFRIAFDDYHERLERYYAPQEARAAHGILRELAAPPGLVSRSALLARYLDEIGGQAVEDDFDLLMTWLMDDFYIDRVDAKNYAFKLRWLRDWWRKWHG